jgi:hypothetical protein
MPFYRVMLHGSGIRIPGEKSGQEIIGFYTTRLVRAPSEETAVIKARAKVEAQWSEGRYAHSNEGSIPDLSTEWVRRTSFLDLFFFKATGHVFYPEDDGSA